MTVNNRTLPRARVVQFSRRVEGTDYNPGALLMAAAEYLSQSGDTLISLGYNYDGYEGREYLDVTTEPQGLA